MKNLLFFLALGAVVILASCGDDDEVTCTEVTWYADADGDGLGDPTTTLDACEAPEGYVDNADDNNDTLVASVTLGGTVIVTNTFQSVPFGFPNEFVFEKADAATVVDGNDLQIFDYQVDISENAITFSIPADTQNDLFRTIEPGTFDRYYFTFDSDLNIQGVTTSTTGLSAGVIDGSTVFGMDGSADADIQSAQLVIEISEGFEFAAGISFTISLEGDVNSCTSQTYYADADGDGFGDATTATEGCVRPAGYVFNDKDLDDTQNGVTIISNLTKAVALIEAFQSGDSSVLNYISDAQYINHNLNVPDGKDVIAGVFPGNDSFGMTVEVHRAFQDGDLVAIHTTYGGTAPGLFGFESAEIVGFDVFRFENGLIVEHWDNLQEISDPKVSEANGNTQVDGPTEINTSFDTQASKSYIQTFTDDLLVGGDWSGAGAWFNGEPTDESSYIQHSYGTANGYQWILDIGTFGFDGVPFYRTGSPEIMVGNGDFVLIGSQGAGTFDDGAQAYYDLFRLIEVDGQLYVAEHWDTQQAIPTDGEGTKW